MRCSLVAGKEGELTIIGECRLKDSDVTWLYGPLHTAIHAVPPPRVATASERLGLEPLRSLSDSKKLRAKSRPPPTTKPILKYRSLSDILLPAGSPASPILEHVGIDFDSGTVPISSKSDSNLARMGLNRERSPIHTPREQSPDRAMMSDSSSSNASRNGDTKRHISFNHRVEQCIAIDSTDVPQKYATMNSGSGSEDDGDDEDDVLTFKSSSSPRVASFGPSAMSAAHARSHSDRSEPHTISWLGPTTLKSVELYPAPSPAVYYQNQADSPANKEQQSYAQATVAAKPQEEEQQPGRQQAGRRAMYDYAATGGLANQWDAEDEDEDYAMGFDYFTGPDVGVADEYDMAQYGSQHLNNYQAGAPATYHSNGPYSPSSPYAPSPSHSSVTSTESSPNHSRRSSNSTPTPKSPTSSTPPSPSSAVASNGIRGPHAPPATKEAVPPKRSILKNRSREPSATHDEPPHPSQSARCGSASPSTSPTSSSPSPTSSSPQTSPHASSSSLAAVMASAGIPQAVHMRSGPSGIRRVGSEEVVREARGRSTSRGSSCSLERSASADRRSSSSISPSSSYSPPISVGPPARAVGTLGQRRGGSSDSLSSLGGSLIGGSLPDLPEASSESETETVRAQPEGEEFVEVHEHTRGRRLSNDGSISGEIEQVEDVVLHSPAGTTTSLFSPPPLVPAPTTSGSPRYRQPLPSAPTTSTNDEEGQGKHVETASLSGSPALDPADLAAAPWSDEPDVAPSYARRSLLRAARGGHASGGLEREESRGSIDSGRGSTTGEDYGFGYYDEEGETGIVGRTLEVAGTARDLLGAISKGIWNLGRRS